MGETSFGRVVIVGPGLIGGSLGMALRLRRCARRVVGVGRSRASLDRAIEVGALDEATLDLLSAVEDADIVVLCTGVGRILEHLSTLAPRMRPGSILTDVGSVKGVICHAARSALARGSGAAFVGAHPLAGSEQRGVAAARADLFEGSTCVLTPLPETDPDGAALGTVRALWQSVGCCTREMSPEEHDRLLAEASHLPHLVAAALVNAVSDDALALAARGFLDTTRIASGDAGLWVEICLANRGPIRAALDRMGMNLGEIAVAIESGDAERLYRYLGRAKERRDRRLEQESHCRPPPKER